MPTAIASEEGKYYARPNGKHYHADLKCPMLNDGQFKDYGYKEVTKEEVNKRNLFPCSCVPGLKRRLSKGE